VDIQGDIAINHKGETMNRTITIISLSAVLACLTLLAQESPRAPAAPASPATRLGSGEHTRMIVVGSLQRSYRVHVPKKHAVDHPTPVIVVFHGGGGNPESMVRLLIGEISCLI
jgi:poly(3-hydroxybutyrate) depolymerase